MRTAQDLMLSSFTWLEDYQKANDVSKQPKKVIMQVWKPATNGNMILNVDATFLSNQHHGGIGGILRDSAGNLKADFSRPILYTASPKLCELQAKDVYVHSDCLEAIAEMKAQDHRRMEDSMMILNLVNSKLVNVQIMHTPMGKLIG